MGNFPIETYIFFVLAILGLCTGVILLLTSTLSEDKERGIIAQLWETFFGNSTDDR